MNALSAEAIANIRVGDSVTIRRKVVSVAGQHAAPVPVRVAGTEWICAEDILSHEPRAFAVGDKVLYADLPYEVLAVHGQWLWGERADGGMWTLIASSCQRVEDAP